MYKLSKILKIVNILIQKELCECTYGWRMSTK